MVAILLAGCGPFRPPAFDNNVNLRPGDQMCIASIKGSWPNLPGNPVEWFVGGRTPLTVEIHFPNSRGRYEAQRIVVYYVWPSSSYPLKQLSGHIEFDGQHLSVDLMQNLRGTPERLREKGSYVVRNPDGCS